MIRLRKFAIGIIKSKGVSSVAQKMRKLCFSPRMVFVNQHPKMTHYQRPKMTHLVIKKRSI